MMINHKISLSPRSTSRSRVVIRTTISPSANKLNKIGEKENKPAPVVKTEIEFLSDDSDDLNPYMKKG